MKPFLRGSVVAVLLLSVGIMSSVTARAQELYGVTFFSNELISVDTTTGGASLIGPTAQISAYGLATYSGNLYTFDAGSGSLLQLDGATGAALNSTSLGGPNAFIGEGDLAIRGDGAGFLTSNVDPNTFNQVNRFYRFDVATGQTVLVGDTGVALDGLAFDGNNVLFGLGQADGNLYTVDQNTGATTLVGNAGIGVGSPFGALTFAPDGTLYAALDDNLFTINPLTGAATQVNPTALNLGFTSVSGLAFRPGAAIPEPSSIALLCLGGASLLRRRRSR